MILILFGVSGTGKTTIGRLLSERLGWRFVEGDDYHSPANRQKMQAGIPLTDEDRQPWLNVLHQIIKELIGQRENAVVACSALKQKYRDRLVAGFEADQFRFALLDLPRDLLRERIEKRHHPYMNPNLLDSQLATLEVPAAVWRISVSGTAEEAVEQVCEKLKNAGNSRPGAKPESPN
jgi:gluconokinase